MFHHTSESGTGTYSCVLEMEANSPQTGAFRQKNKQLNYSFKRAARKFQVAHHNLMAGHLDQGSMFMSLTINYMNY